jgi:6-phosphogluconolactonase (cycloisomerase 2 family)/predicted transcriptional regulator
MFASLLGHFHRAQARAALGAWPHCRAVVRAGAAIVCATALNACGGGGGGAGDLPPAQSYSVGGSLSGLSAGASATLTNNGTDSLNVAGDGAFTFAKELKAGSAYSVSVTTQPTGEQCSVSNGSGSVVASNVTNVAIACSPMATPTYSVGGSVSGLSAGTSVTLTDNGSSSLTVTGNGVYTFATKLTPGTAYSVSVATQPTGQQCSITNGSGSIAGSNVTNVGVTCAPIGTPTYSVGGSVSGLSPGASVTLTDNGTDSLTVSGNGAFTFATELTSGAGYAVAVATQPTGEHCSVTNGSGWIAASNVTNVTIACSPAPSYSVGGSVSGLSSGASVTLTDNGTGSLKVSANGAFTFATKLTSGAAYAVAVASQPTGEHCSVTNGSGWIAASNVTNVVIACSSAPTYSVGGSVSGLSSGASVTLTDNGTDSLKVSANGAFTFATKLASGAAYTVVVATQPTGEHCSVANGSGSIGASNVTNVAVSCSPTATTATLLYITNATAGSIDGLSINRSTGVPTPISGSPWTDGPAPAAIAIDPQKRFLYVSTASGEIRGYLIDGSTLKLSAISGSPFPTSAHSVAIAVDPSGQFVLTANGTSNTVSVFKIASTGALTEVTGSPFPAGSNASAVVVAAGQFVYVANTAGHSLSAYRMDTTTGALTAVTGSPFAAGATPNGLVVDDSGTHVYATASAPNSVAGFTINGSTGALTPITGSPYAAKYAISSPVMDGEGKRLHGTNGTDVDCFWVNGDYSLSELGLSVTNGKAIALTLDRQDNFLYALDNVNNQVEVFSIAPADGALTLISGSPFALFSGSGTQSLGPNAIAVQH